MKTKLRLPVFLLFFLMTTAFQKVDAQEISIDYFYDNLAPYGRWIDVDRYGWVWQPYDMEPDWRPYTDGNWIYTDYGLTFQSPRKWAWAAYHYGRWFFSDNYGWLWVPGRVWGPAWVAWRHGGDYIGWAPLPPEAEWYEERGFYNPGFNIDVDIHLSRWCFVDRNRFLEPNLIRHIHNPGRNITIVKYTNNITRYTIVNHRIYNNCIDFHDAERFTHTKIHRYNVVDIHSHNNAGYVRSKNNEIDFYRPSFSDRRPDRTPHNEFNQRNDDRDRIIKRQKQEERQFEKSYESRSRDLNKYQKKELKKSTDYSNREKEINRHQSEKQALEENKSREKRAIENRHREELKSVKNNDNQKNNDAKERVRKDTKEAKDSKDKKNNNDSRERKSDKNDRSSKRK